MYETFYPGNGNNSKKVAINIRLGTLLSFLYAHLLSCKLCFCPNFGTAGMQKMIGTERPALPKYYYEEDSYNNYYCLIGLFYKL